MRHMSTEATTDKGSPSADTTGFAWGAVMLVNNDNFGKVVNKGNPSINFSPFHTKSQEC